MQTGHNFEGIVLQTESYKYRSKNTQAPTAD